MYIDIHRRPTKGYVAVAKAGIVPESWTGARLFKTIELLPGQVRIALGDAIAILEAIDKDGYADLGGVQGRITPIKSCAATPASHGFILSAQVGEEEASTGQPVYSRCGEPWHAQVQFGRLVCVQEEEATHCCETCALRSLAVCAQ